MAKEWTAERRAAQAETMRKRHEAKRNHQPDTNPPANDDIIQEAASQRAVRTPRAARPAPEENTIPVFLVATLNQFSEPGGADALTYADCGELLNALSAASTAIALRRRMAQEQLAAGSHRAPCATCGRQIDISKSGGFQILTERDEHFQPRNVYYCSQNCLLAKNMPSHRVKKIPGDVGAKV